MTPYERARSIVQNYASEDGKFNRPALVEEIRRAIIQGDIESRQPKEFSPDEAGSITYQIVSFVDSWIETWRECGYPRQANELQACRRKVIALSKALRKPVGSQGLDDSRKVVNR